MIFLKCSKHCSHTLHLQKSFLSHINLQRFESSSASLSEVSFFLLVLRAPYFKKCVRCFKALGDPCIQTINFFIRIWVEFPTHGLTGSVSFQGLRRWPQFHSHRPKESGEFTPSRRHTLPIVGI